MAEQFQNFFVTKLREACDAVATTIYVDTVPAITEGTLILEYNNSTKHEIIHFTGVSGYGLTGCTRGLEGTTAQSHSAGTDVRQNLTAGMIDKIINGVITTENIADSAVTTAKIDNGAVTADKIDFTTIVEVVGTDENYCIKYSDGRMTAVQRVTINTSITDTWGNIYSRDFSNTSFPEFAVQFISQPIGSVSVFSSAGLWICSFGNFSTQKLLGITLARPTAMNSITAYIDIVAYGRWKA